ncbi:6-phosphofructo-2-kinase/fructose-2,6-bisphosphatase 3, partial [Cichlidogyrus casuarinus]
MEDMLSWLAVDQNSIAVFDATNTTRERRNILLENCTGYNLIFIESICNNMQLVKESILEVKVKSPDYISMSAEQAIEDFLNRIQHYEMQYEPIDDTLDSNLSYVKIINQGERFIVNNIQGALSSRMIYYLMNMRVGKRTIYITRHGESEFNLVGKIGGDSKLSPRGQQYAKSLADFIKSQNIPDLKVWTSHMMRTRLTARDVPCSEKESWKALDEIDAVIDRPLIHRMLQGCCDSLTYEEIQSLYPADFARRDQDKFNYRYPMGESYQDLVYRVEPVIMELEHQSHVLLVCHQAVARCILAYFLN